MKCPRCGNELAVDSHRKIPLNMCYNCGYIESYNTQNETIPGKFTSNFEHLKSLNFNEAAAFLAGGLGIAKDKLIEWLDKSF